MYIYRSCCGDLYTSEEYIEETYCETCGDWDWCLGYVSTKEQLISILEDEYFSDEYIEEFIKENWTE